MSNPIRVNQKTWLTKMSACKTMNKTWIAFGDGTIIFQQSFFFPLPYIYFFTSSWITMHSRPAEQTNHSPALVFLSNCSPESLCLAHSFFLLHRLVPHTLSRSLPVWVNEIANARPQFGLESISADVMGLTWLHIKFWFNAWLQPCGYSGHYWTGRWTGWMDSLLLWFLELLVVLMSIWH